MKPSRLVPLAVLGACLMFLSGCAQAGDVAVKVDSVTFTNADVDLLVDFQCAASAAQSANDPSGAAATASRAQVRSEMASRLLDSAVYETVGQRVGTEPNREQIKTDLAGLPDVVNSTVPAADRARVIELITATYTSASRFEAAFVQKYGVAALQQMDEQAIAAAAQELKDTVLKSADIEINPVYGLTKTSPTANPNDASLSLPVSSFARDAAAGQASADWIAGLPKSQTCG